MCGGKGQGMLMEESPYEEIVWGSGLVEGFSVDDVWGRSRLGCYTTRKAMVPNLCTPSDIWET